MGVKQHKEWKDGMAGPADRLLKQIKTREICFAVKLELYI
jgi:hypothetical protein